MPARLDSIDRKILKELQADGRITNVELASRVGISAPPCLRRVRALEEAGYIKGYRALLDEKKLGYEVAVFAMVLPDVEDDVGAVDLILAQWAERHAHAGEEKLSVERHGHPLIE